MSKKKWVRVNMNFEKDEYLRLKKGAETMGLYFGPYVRFLLKGRDPRPPQAPELTAVLDETAELVQSLQQGLLRNDVWQEQDLNAAEHALTSLRELRLKIMEETLAPVPKEVESGDM